MQSSRGRIKTLAQFIRSALVSKRSHGALLATSFSSVGNFALTIAIARNGSVEDVAQFAIGFAGFTLISGLAIAMVGEPAAVRLLTQEQLRAAGQQVSLYGLFYSIPLLLIGILWGQTHLLLVGSLCHGISFYSYSKFISTAFGRPYISIFQELIRCLAIIVMVFMPTINDPLLIFSLWLIITAAVGYGGACVQHIRVIPSYSNKQIPIRESASYAMDFALGSGTTQLTTFLLGAMASPSVNASVRGTGTLLGPVTMIASSTRSLLLPFLARKSKQEGGLDAPLNISFTLLAITFPLILLINFIPDSWGVAILGETWILASNVLPILSFEVIFTMLTTIPFAGHRTLGAHHRVLILRTVLAGVRLVTILTAAIVGGYILAAYAMVFTSTLGFLCWWISYVSLTKQRENSS